MQTIKIKKNEPKPKYPHCEVDLAEINIIFTEGVLNTMRAFVYTCPNCKKVLTISGT